MATRSRDVTREWLPRPAASKLRAERGLSNLGEAAQALRSGIVITEDDRTVTPLRGTYALAKLSQVVIDVDDFALGGPAGGLVVATGVQRYPAAAEFVNAADLLPRHALTYGPARRGGTGAGPALWRGGFGRT